MDIGLGIEALSPQLTGIGRYTWELATRLPHFRNVRSLKLFRDGKWFARGDSFLTGEAPRRQRTPKWIERSFAKRDFERRLFHGPNFFFPERSPNALVTVHDLSVFRFPETHPIERIKQFDREFSRSVSQARHIITDSLYIKNELIDLFGISENLITPIPLGVSESFFEVGEEKADEAFLSSQDLRHKDYCLCVATIEPRKGLDHAVKSFLRYKSISKNSTKLVIVGASGWNNSALHDLFERSKSSGNVKFMGFLDDRALRILYRNCSLFLYPSLYEGFGLPVLEAMASKAPVLISDQSCLPEVSGDAAMSVFVQDHVAFSHAIGEALENTSWRDTTVEKGHALAKRRNWNACAESTSTLYQTISK